MGLFRKTLSPFLIQVSFFRSPFWWPRIVVRKWNCCYKFANYVYYHIINNHMIWRKRASKTAKISLSPDVARKNEKSSSNSHPVPLTSSANFVQTNLKNTEGGKNIEYFSCWSETREVLAFYFSVSFPQKPQALRHQRREKR